MAAEGGRFGGYSFYLIKGKLVLHYNLLNTVRTTIVSDEEVPLGKSTLRYEFTARDKSRGGGGTGKLYINDRQVAEGRIARTGAQRPVDRRVVQRGHGHRHARFGRLSESVHVHRHARARHDRTQVARRRRVRRHPCKSNSSATQPAPGWPRAGIWRWPGDKCLCTSAARPRPPIRQQRPPRSCCCTAFPRLATTGGPWSTVFPRRVRAIAAGPAGFWSLGQARGL